MEVKNRSLVAWSEESKGFWNAMVEKAVADAKAAAEEFMETAEGDERLNKDATEVAQSFTAFSFCRFTLIINRSDCWRNSRQSPGPA